MKQEGILKLRSARWHVSGRLLTLLTVASIMMTAPFLSGCATSRKVSAVEASSVKQAYADSLRSEVRRMWTESVPEEEAKLEISLEELKKLPVQAEYRAKNGRASATVKNNGGTIVVYATCDSLQRQCEYLEREMAKSKTALEGLRNGARTVDERCLSGWKMLLLAYIVGVATGIVSTIIIKRIWQNRRNSCTA